MQVVFCELLRLKDFECLSLLKTCGCIRQKKMNEKIIVSIVMDQWISFTSQCELFKVKLASLRLVLLPIIKVKEGHDIHSNRDEVNIFLYQSSYTVQSSYSASNNKDASIKLLFPVLIINRYSRTNILV